MHDDDGITSAVAPSRGSQTWQQPVLRRSVFDAGIVGLTAVMAGFVSFIPGMGQTVTRFLGNFTQYQFDDVLLAPLTVGLGFAYFGIRRLIDLHGEVTRRISAESLAEKLVILDVLTGLPNRAHFLDEITRSMARTKRSKGFLAVVVINIRKFDLVNVGISRSVGDRLLIEFSKQLRSISRGNESLARLDADNFGMIAEFKQDNDMDAVRKAMQRLSNSLNQPVSIDDMSIDLDVNIGASLYPHDATEAHSLLRFANASMRRGKLGISGNTTFFEQSADDALREQAALELELKSAIHAGDIVPVYQPLIDLQRGSVIGYEILARWHHAERGFISPGKFIPIAEASGVITDLTLSVLNTACREWKANDLEVFLALNVSPIDLRDPWFPEKLLATLTKTGFPANLLEIEITENSIVEDPAAAHRAILSLKNQGVRVALDDFGAGYSNLSQLSNLCIDKIKIDQLFISTMLQDETNMAVVKTIIGLANVMEIPVVTEGIETQEQADTLKGMGCDFGQGFLFSRPVGAADLASLQIPMSADRTQEVAKGQTLSLLSEQNALAVTVGLAGPEADKAQADDNGRLTQLGQLCATVAHQLRNPLGSIRNAAYVINRKTSSDRSDLEAPLQRINSAIVRSDQLISQLLDFTRSNTIELQFDNLDVWLELVVRDQADSLPEIVALRLELATGGQKLGFDPQKMQCIVNHLVANASEALVGKGDNPDEFFCPDPQIVVKSSLTQRGVEIAVTNNGPAISKDDMHKILEPLYTTKRFGTGLGLPLVADHLRLHGGGLDLESGETSGVTFVAWFPLNMCPIEPVAVAKPHAAVA